MPYGIDKKVLKSHVLTALREWHTVGGSSLSLLEDLLLIKESAQTDHKVKKRLNTNSLLIKGIGEMAQQNAEFAELLKNRFIEKVPSKKIAFNKNISIDAVNRIQRKAINELSDVIFEYELQYRREIANKRESQLPPSQYTKLFGFEEAIEAVQTQVQNQTLSFVVSVVGMGGMGKTALIDFVTRQIIRTFLFHEVIWIRVTSSPINGRLQSPELTFEGLIAQIAYQLWPDSAHSLTDKIRHEKVRQSLKERPYLIVIDNLEAATDSALLFDYLNDLANPSKFLLTTRIQPPRQSNVFGLTLEGLSFEQAKALLKYHAQDIGIDFLDDAEEKDFVDIYEHTGGNPFALRLVVSMLDTYPLPHILQNLMLSVEGDIQQMYQRIFQQAWNTLSNDAKRLLKAMPLVSQTGVGPEILSKMINVTEADIWPLISELKSRSLIESQGGLSERRYSIHQLTNTFLQSEIINWEKGAWST
ncbi:MAG: ATP-binding protein [Chloroflexota bacterium]